MLPLETLPLLPSRHNNGSDGRGSGLQVRTDFLHFGQRKRTMPSRPKNGRIGNGASGRASGVIVASVSVGDLTRLSPGCLHYSRRKKRRRRRRRRRKKKIEKVSQFLENQFLENRSPSSLTHRRVLPPPPPLPRATRPGRPVAGAASTAASPPPPRHRHRHPRCRCRCRGHRSLIVSHESK